MSGMSPNTRLLSFQSCFSLNIKGTFVMFPNTDAGFLSCQSCFLIQDSGLSLQGQWPVCGGRDQEEPVPGLQVQQVPRCQHEERG